MQNNSNFTLANRKHLADMLDPGYHSLRERAKDHLKRKRSSLAQTIIREFAEKKGVLKVKVQIDATRERLNEQERELTQLGCGTKKSLRGLQTCSSSTAASSETGFDWATVWKQHRQITSAFMSR